MGVINIKLKFILHHPGSDVSMTTGGLREKGEGIHGRCVVLKLGVISIDVVVDGALFYDTGKGSHITMRK